MRTLVGFLLLAALPLTLSACDDPGGGAPSEPVPTSDLGRQGEAIYRAVVEDGNTFACSTCHALTEPASEFRRPGHSLGDAAARPSYKNGQLTQMRDAVNSCLTEWMNAEPWTEQDDRWVALSTFLDEIAPSSAEALSFTVLSPPTAADLAGGDAAAGQALFNESCAVCHGADGAGTERGLPVAGRALDPEYIGLRVRSSGRADSEIYGGLTGGVMPFWAADRLSNAELANIVAWLADNDGNADDGFDDGGDNDPDDGGDDNSDGDAGDTGEPEPDPDTGGDDGPEPGGECDVTHPRVGQTAELVEAFHDVGGTAQIIDDCTIRITNFTFDGTGIDVRLYGGLGGDYDNGVSIGEDLRRDEPYAGETLDFTLPAGVTFDDIDGLSVWCVPAGVDFGSGSFE